jgi:hypothetical protein
MNRGIITNYRLACTVIVWCGLFGESAIIIRLLLPHDPIICHMKMDGFVCARSTYKVPSKE